MKLRIKNFQILSDVELEFKTGITAIVGPSNSGKTSILRALGCILNNSSEAKSYIKHGKISTEVSLELDNKPTIKWTRTLKGSNYNIDGENYDKVGKSGLLDLIELKEFYKDDDSNDLINIQDEWSLLFPFQKTDSQMYKLFEDIFSINDSTVIFKKIKEDESICKKELCNLNSELSRNTDKFNSLKEYLENIDGSTLIGMRNSLVDSNNYLSNINRDISDLKSYLKRYDVLRRLKREEFDLSILDDYVEIEKDYSYIFNNKNILESKLDRLDFDFSCLDEFVFLKEDCDRMIDYLKQYNSLKEELRKCSDEKEDIKFKLKDVKTCPLCRQELKEGDDAWI